MKLHNYIFAVLFGILGLTALFAVLFMGATHQLAVVVICFGMATALYYDAKKLEA